MANIQSCVKDKISYLNFDLEVTLFFIGAVLHNVKFILVSYVGIYTGHLRCILKLPDEVCVSHMKCTYAPLAPSSSAAKSFRVFLLLGS